MDIVACGNTKDSVKFWQAKVTEPGVGSETAASDEDSVLLGPQVLSRETVGGPFYQPGPPWIVHQLALQCMRIDLERFSYTDDLLRMLWAMAGEGANVHLGLPDARGHILDQFDERAENRVIIRGDTRVTDSRAIRRKTGLKKRDGDEP